MLCESGGQACLQDTGYRELSAAFVILQQSIPEVLEQFENCQTLQATPPKFQIGQALVAAILDVA